MSNKTDKLSSYNNLSKEALLNIIFKQKKNISAKE